MRNVCHCRSAMHPACQLRWVAASQDPVCRICKEPYTNLVSKQHTRCDPDGTGVYLLATAGIACTTALSAGAIYLQETLRTPEWGFAFVLSVFGAVSWTSTGLCVYTLVQARCRLRPHLLTQHATWSSVGSVPTQSC